MKNINVFMAIIILSIPCFASKQSNNEDFESCQSKKNKANFDRNLYTQIKSYYQQAYQALIERGKIKFQEGRPLLSNPVSGFLNELNENKICFNSKIGNPYTILERLYLIEYGLKDCTHTNYGIKKQILHNPEPVSSMPSIISNTNRLIKSKKKIKKITRKNGSHVITYQVVTNDSNFRISNFEKMSRLESLKLLAFIGPLYDRFCENPKAIDIYRKLYKDIKLPIVHLKLFITRCFVETLINRCLKKEFGNNYIKANLKNMLLNGELYSNIRKLSKSKENIKKMKGLYKKKLMQAMVERNKVIVNLITPEVLEKENIDINLLLNLEQKSFEDFKRAQFKVLSKLAEKKLISEQNCNLIKAYFNKFSSYDSKFSELHKKVDTYFDKFLRKEVCNIQTTYASCNNYLSIYKEYMKNLGKIIKLTKAWKPIYVAKKTTTNVRNQYVQKNISEIKQNTSKIKKNAIEIINLKQKKKDKKNITRIQNRLEKNNNYNKLERYKMLIALQANKNPDEVHFSKNIEINLSEEELEEAIDAVKLMKLRQQQREKALQSNTINTELIVPKAACESIAQKERYQKIHSALMKCKKITLLSQHLLRSGFQSLNGFKLKKIRGTDLWSLRFNKQYRFVIWQDGETLAYVFTKHYKGIKQIKN